MRCWLRLRRTFRISSSIARISLELREMLAERGVDFETYPEAFKWGTWMRRVTFERPFTIADMANIPAEHRPAPDALVTRSEVRAIDMAEFVRVKNRREVIFEGAEPQT